jgi:RNA polymerase sigma factor (TIGR02999 family)
MAEAANVHITQLLKAWSSGDSSALENLTPHVYKELHRIARRYMVGERPSHTLQATALINEAYLRLIDWKNVEWNNRCHFFAVGAQMMRKILVDHARARGADKRGANGNKVTLDTGILSRPAKSMDLVALDDALRQLHKFDARKSEVIELRIFGGLTNEEAAEALGISVTTIRRDWKLALAWLRRELGVETIDDS